MEYNDPITNIKNDVDVDNSISQLLEQHENLFRYFNNKYAFASGIVEDLNGNKEDLIYRTALEFDKDKTKFSTFLSHQIRYRYLQEINKNKNLVCIDDVGENCFLCDNKDSSEKEDLKEYVFDILGQLSDERILKIIDLRYFDYDSKKDRTYKQIGQKMGLSYEWTRKLHQDGIRFLKSKMSSKVVFDGV